MKRKSFFRINAFRFTNGNIGVILVKVNIRIFPSPFLTIVHIKVVGDFQNFLFPPMRVWKFTFALFGSFELGQVVFHIAVEKVIIESIEPLLIECLEICIKVFQHLLESLSKKFLAEYFC